MDDKKTYIVDLGNFLASHGATMAANELAEHLNRNGFKTYYGSEYEGARGTYTLIRAVYHDLVAEGRQAEADNLAGAFTKPDGSYAFD